VTLAVRKDINIPNEIIEQQAEYFSNDNSGRMQLCYVISNQNQPPREVEPTFAFSTRSFIMEKFSLDDVTDITRTFREDNFEDWKKRLIENGDAGLTETHYHHLELEELKDSYYFLYAEKVLYDSGAIGEDEDYQNTPFYRFFIRKLKLGIHQDSLSKPVSFSNGALIILNAVYGGF